MGWQRWDRGATSKLSLEEDRTFRRLLTPTALGTQLLASSSGQSTPLRPTSCSATPPCALASPSPSPCLVSMTYQSARLLKQLRRLVLMLVLNNSLLLHLLQKLLLDLQLNYNQNIPCR